MGVFTALLLGGSALLLAQVSEPEAARKSPPSLAGPPVKAVTGPMLSTTDRVARLVLSLEADRQQLERLRARLEDPQSEYRKAQAQFKEIDASTAAKKRELQSARDAGQATLAATRQQELDELLQDWGLARERFNIAIEERKTLQEKMLVLQQKVEQDQRALDQLLGVIPPQPSAVTTDSTGSVTPTPPGTSPPALPTLATAAKDTSAESGKTVSAGPSENRATNKVLQKAKEEAQAKEQAAQAARARVESLEKRLKALRSNIELERTFLQTAQKKEAHAHERRAALEKELASKPGQDPRTIAELRKGLAEATRWQEEAHADIQASMTRLEELAGDLAALQAEQANAASEAERRRQEAEAAETLVSRLQNPYTLANILQWIINQGPRLILILAGMWLLHYLVKLSSRRIVRIMVNSNARGTEEERENRAQTLVGVFRNAATLAILGGGAVMLMDALGIPIIPLMGGAAVIGLAVAFGAQNLIRDYFAGFMVLLENQYGINDVVKINGTGGKVERITLRMTVLRDAQGIVHFMPHGTITNVSNLTHGYSLAHFELGVAYKEDVDYVMGVLLQLGKELRQDPNFGPRILDDPEMQGVDRFEDSAVILRFSIKTRPLQQWSVKREMLRRIKYRFDELGIEIPFPHRTIYHRYEGTPPPGVTQEDTREAAA